MEENKPSHISYKDYRKKVNKNPNEGMMIFASAFFILLLLFLGIAKQISPEVDVSIGDDSTEISQNGMDKSEIDERLKLLQMEDEGVQQKEDDTFASELDEKVVIPEHKKAEVKSEPAAEEEPVRLSEKEATPKPSQTASPQVNQTAKVVVGYYSSKEQAEVAKGIIAESGLNITPFVRSISGAYTIQVGSFTTREKAQNLTNELLRNNYPARIIVE